MPNKNSVKISVKNGYYHIYNRGVEKRTIFEDIQDYKVFLSYLKEYLSAPPKPEDLLKSFTLQGTSFQGVPHLPKNYFRKIDLLVYCLMPNHFHFIIKQIHKGSMEGFMRSLATRYSMYFNKKYKRVGPLYQGIYKASMITDDSYLLHLSRYIHLNPLEYTNSLTSAYSSYGEYLGLRKTDWINTQEILFFFNKEKSDFLKSVNTYKNFVEKYNSDDSYDLGEGTLEDKEK
jgi:putative transposase